MELWEETDVTITLDQCAYRLPKGHTLRLACAPSYWPFIWPAPHEAEWTIASGQLEVPVLDVASTTEVGFEEPEAASPWQIEVLRPAGMTREVLSEDGEYFSWLVIETDNGCVKDLAHGLVTGSTCREEWNIPDHTEEAHGRIRWETEMGRDDWSIRTVCTAEMTADETNWYPRARIEAYEGDTLVFAKDFASDIPRYLM